MAKKESFFSIFKGKKSQKVEKPEEKVNEEKVNSLSEDLDFEELTFSELGEAIEDELENYDEFYFDDEFDMNSIPLFDVKAYREIFMQLRKQIDDLYDNHNNTYEERQKLALLFKDMKAAAYNDVVAEDFLGYCYKRGKYSYIPQNYENYMDITLLSAAKGNPFSIQRLQLFMTVAVSDFLDCNGHEEIIDELNISEENYTIFLTKVICDNMVKILNITMKDILSRDGIFREQSDSLLRKYERVRAEALKISIEELESSAKELVSFYTIITDSINKTNSEQEETEQYEENSFDEEIQDEEDETSSTNDEFVQTGFFDNDETTTQESFDNEISKDENEIAHEIETENDVLVQKENNKDETINSFDAQVSQENSSDMKNETKTKTNKSNSLTKTTGSKTTKTNKATKTTKTTGSKTTKTNNTKKIADSKSAKTNNTKKTTSSKTASKAKTSKPDGSLELQKKK